MITREQIANLNLDEKLLAMEYLWEELSKKDDESIIPEWHRLILKERQKEAEMGNAKYHS